MHSTISRAGRRRILTLLAAAIVPGIAACNLDKLLEIETPSRVAEDRYLVPENANLIVSSAVADFECALGAYIVAGGLAAGELNDGSQTASRWSYDRRDVLASDSHYSTFGCTAIGVYTPISTARHTNDQAAQLLAGWTDAQVANRQRLLATSSALAGYSLLLLGEGFCSGVINVGPELTSAQLFDSAEVRFTTAIAAAQAAGDANLLNLARVGRARALRNGGDLAAAAADAALVPANFVYTASASTSAARRNNRVYTQNSGGATTVAEPYRNLGDPRVPTRSAGSNTSDQQQLWLQEKYASITAPTPIATGIEAQLILAEARGGAEGVLILNQLRAGRSMGPLTPAQAANFTATLYQERSRWLWLEGQRWFDLRYANLALVPAAGTPYRKGGTYGDQRCWPLPDVEKLSNPNI